MRAFKRRFIFSSIFLGLALIFVSFQNFDYSTQTKNLFAEFSPQALQEAFRKTRTIELFQPYHLKEKIGSLATPFGYRAYSQSNKEQIVFDDKKFLTDKWHASPLYNETKDFFDMSTQDDNPEPCIRNPNAALNNCFVNYTRPQKDSSSGMKFRANPLRRIASISYESKVSSQLQYDEAQKSVNLGLSKKLNKNSRVNVEMKSQDQSGQINLNLDW